MIVSFVAAQATTMQGTITTTFTLADRNMGDEFQVRRSRSWCDVRVRVPAPLTNSGGEHDPQRCSEET